MANESAFDPSTFISERAKRWKPASIRSLLPLEALPDMITLLAGKPNPSTFPIKQMTLSMDAPNGQGAPVELVLQGETLADGLQYCLPAGLEDLVKWLLKLQERVHEKPIDATRWSLSVGNGSQELIHKTFQVLTDEGDSVLIDSPTYSGTLGFLKADKLNLVEVGSDNHGMLPADLERNLSKWETLNPGKRRPRVLYSIPSGCNPTGASTSEPRKVEVLKLAKKYNFLILEDDAYFYLDYLDAGNPRPRSYLALETEVNGEDGRVVRFDTLSKIMSAGARVGFITGPTAILSVVDTITANTNLQGNSIGQAIVLAILQHWGIEGFLAHCDRVAAFYGQRCKAFVALADKHLAGLATWTVPRAGMFVFIKLLLTTDDSEGDSFAVIRDKAVQHGVLAVPGTAFMPSGRDTCYVRVSFSIVNDALAEEACIRLRRVILEARQEWADHHKHHINGA